MNNEADFWFTRADIDVVRDKELSITAKFIFTVFARLRTRTIGDAGREMRLWQKPQVFPSRH